MYGLTLLPNNDLGTFVMIDDASTVIMDVAVEGTVSSLKAGGVKVLGIQSSMKKPIVLATGGSTDGLIVVVSGGGLVVLFVASFLQAKRVVTRKKGKNSRRRLRLMCNFVC